MTLARFRAQNHPQQVDARGARERVDDRGTPPNLFEPLHRRFRFTVDAAAQAHNAKLGRFWSPADDGLAQDWTGERVWCNPPYSSIEPWVEKAHQEALNGCPLTVMLLPANRTEQGWWQDHVEPCRDGRGRCGLQVEFLRGRQRFIAAGGAEVGPNERPPFGVCLLVWAL